MKIRFATDRDGPAVATLIGEVLKEYGDCICLDAGGSEEDVLQIQSAYFDAGGAFWVLESEAGQVIGCNAIKLSQSEAATAELKRMYLAKSARGSGAAEQLLDESVEWAANRFLAKIELWSDSRFERGHRFYEKHGFQPTGRFRDMDNSHEPYRELHFSRCLT